MSCEDIFTLKVKNSFYFHMNYVNDCNTGQNSLTDQQNSFYNFVSFKYQTKVLSKRQAMTTKQVQNLS